MNISSCETAQGLVGGLWPKMEATTGTICEAVGNSQGLFSDWAASRQGCNNGDKRDETIAANTNQEMKNSAGRRAAQFHLGYPEQGDAVRRL